MDNKWFNEHCIHLTKVDSGMIHFFNIDFYSLKKYIQLRGVLENPFISHYQKERFSTFFSHAQRFIHSIYRVKHMWKWKRAKTYNTEDLFMNHIDAVQKNVVVLLQNNTKYLFRMGELITSIEKSLSNCSHFFPSPIVCKNPYTNIPFDKSTLYHIYFSVKTSTFLMPALFHTYFMTGFHYNDFLMYNEERINAEFLNTYVENTHFENVFEQVKNMFKLFNIKTRISKYFPKPTLYDIMKPYLKLYFYSFYAINYRLKQATIVILRKKLHDFYAFNPNFGKRKIKLTSITPFSTEKRVSYYFEMEHRPFPGEEYNKTVKTFMRSHLTVPYQEDDSDEIGENSDSSDDNDFSLNDDGGDDETDSDDEPREPTEPMEHESGEDDDEVDIDMS